MGKADTRYDDLLSLSWPKADPGLTKKSVTAQIGEIIEKAGGRHSISTQLASDVTHLVISEAHWKKGFKTPKCKDDLFFL